MSQFDDRIPLPPTLKKSRLLKDIFTLLNLLLKNSEKLP